MKKIQTKKFHATVPLSSPAELVVLSLATHTERPGFNTWGIHLYGISRDIVGWLIPPQYGQMLTSSSCEG